MARDLIGTIRRGLKKPPRVILRRLRGEAAAELDRYLAPLRARRFGRAALLDALGAVDVDSLWERLGNRAHATEVRIAPAAYQ